FEQDRNLVIDAAPATIGTRVAQRPVAVDEAERDGAGVLVASEQTVIVDKKFAERDELVAEAVGRVVVVVQVQFDFTEARATQFTERVQQRLLVFLGGIKERVAWGTTVGILEPAELFRELLDPGLHAFHAGGEIRAAGLGLVMIGHAQDEVNFFVGADRLI